MNGRLDSWVGQLHLPTEARECSPGNQQCGHALPAADGISPVHRCGREDHVVQRAKGQILESCSHDRHCRGHVFAKLAEHRGVGFGCGQTDFTLGEHTRGLARASANFQGSVNRPTGVCQHGIDQLGRIAGPISLIRRSHRAETQRARTRAGDHTTTTRRCGRIESQTSSVRRLYGGCTTVPKAER